MGTSILGCDGRVIPGACSRGGVFAAYDWKDLVFGDTTGAIWEKAKVSALHRLHGFPESEHGPLKRILGWYSDVQSINSEDTVTWSVFHYDPAAWLPEVLDQAFGTALRPAFLQPCFWHRTPHPETGQIGHGPEADVVLRAEGWRYVVEAKWRSDIDSHQGVERNTSQLAMRAHLAEGDGVPEDHRGVLVIVPGPRRYPPAVNPDSSFREFLKVVGERYIALPPAAELSAVAVTWEEIASVLAGVASHVQSASYLRWRLEMLSICR